MDKPLIIGNFQAGIAPSAFLGFQEFRGLNITDKPGVCFPNDAVRRDDNLTLAAAVSEILAYGFGSTPVVWIHDGVGKNVYYRTAYGDWGDDNLTLAAAVSEILAYGFGSTPVVWIHDGVGKNVYYRTAYGDWGAKTGHADSALYNFFNYKGFVGIVHDNLSISYYNATTAVYVTNAAAQVSSGVGTAWIVGPDDALYLARGRYIDKLDEDAGDDFAPATASTYTITQQKVSIPEGDTIQNILNIGDYLFLVGSKKIYPWDCLGDAALIETPIDLGKNIYQSIVYKNRIYVQAGFKGEWYVVQGGQVEYIGRLPLTLMNPGVNIVNVGKPTLSNNNLIMFMVGCAATVTPQGIYSLNPETGAFNLEHIISSGGDGTTYAITPGPVVNLGVATGEMLWAWTENSVYRLDSLNTGTKKTGDLAHLISQFYNVGSLNHPRTFNNPYLVLSQPLSTSDSLKMYYRTAQNGSWTAWSDSNGNATISGTAQTINMTAIPAVANIQVKAILNNNVHLFLIVLI